jgi:hypothetical protein
MGLTSVLTLTDRSVTAIARYTYKVGTSGAVTGALSWDQETGRLLLHSRRFFAHSKDSISPNGRCRLTQGLFLLKLSSYPENSYQTPLCTVIVEIYPVLRHQKCFFSLFYF